MTRSHLNKKTYFAYSSSGESIVAGQAWSSDQSRKLKGHFISHRQEARRRVEEGCDYKLSKPTPNGAVHPTKLYVLKVP